MEQGLEVKFCDIDHDEMRDILERKGAKLVHKEFLMRRVTMDFPDGRLTEKGGWVRVRDEGEKITLSYKQLNDRTLRGTNEVSVDVSDFDMTKKFLQEIGLAVKSDQDT